MVSGSIHFHDDRWPSSIDEAVDIILGMFTVSDREELRHRGELNPVMQKYALGANVQQRLGLTGSRNIRLMNDARKYVDPEVELDLMQISYILIDAVNKRLQTDLRDQDGRSYGGA